MIADREAEFQAWLAPRLGAVCAWGGKRTVDVSGIGWECESCSPLRCLSCDHRSLCYECTLGHVRARLGRGYDAAVEAFGAIGCTPDPDYLAYQATRDPYVRGYREDNGSFRSGFIENDTERRIREQAMARSRAALGA